MRSIVRLQTRLWCVSFAILKVGSALSYRLVWRVCGVSYSWYVKFLIMIPVTLTIQVRAGDVVIAVNDVSVRGWPLSDVKPLLKGPAGMKLRLTVLRPGLCVRCPW